MNGSGLRGGARTVISPYLITLQVYLMLLHPMHFSQNWSSFLSRRLLARLLSTLLCSVLIVTRLLSKYGGSSVFLALTIKELVFSVQENLAQQFEATFLHLTGGLIGIALSVLANYIASFHPPDSTLSRLIPAIFLIGISFSAGWLKSRLPRLTLSARIACFISIWLLTTNTGLQRNISVEATNFLWIILVAASTTLLSSMIFLRWSSPQLACDLIKAMSELQSCLRHNLDVAFSEALPRSTYSCSIQDELLQRSISLNSVYRQATFELRIGRVSVKSMKPLIGTVEHLRRELAWGIGLHRLSKTNTAIETNVRQAFHDPALELGESILDAMHLMERVLLACFEYAPGLTSLRLEKQNLAAAKLRLTTTVNRAREELESICNDLDRQQRALGGQVGFPANIFELCLFMISLLQMAYEILHALDLGEDMMAAYESSPLRLWHPRLSLAWLGVAPSTIILDERGTFLDAETPNTGSSLSLEETFHGFAEQNVYLERMLSRSPGLALNNQDLRHKILLLRWPYALTYSLWSHPQTIKARLSLSSFFKSFQHSPHLRHALKNAVGVGLLSIPSFFPIDSPGRAWFTSSYGQWMLISYIWVLETNTGATWRVAYLRLSGTVVGAIYAYVASLICKSNPFGMVGAVFLAEIPISYIVINTSFPSLGVVSSVTLPPILFSHYFHPESTTSTLTLAILRGLLISAGIIAALIMNSIVFPRHCRVMFLNSTCRTLGYLSQLYMSLSRDLFHQSSSKLDKHKILKLELCIRKSLHRMSILLKTMEDELSLIPKPVQRYSELVVILQKLLDLLTGIRKVRENIPRKETVAAVATQRREMVSCVCISLFACEQVFGARQPLPQFLPSTRLALKVLEKEVEERIQLSRETEPDSFGLSLIYAFAEIDILTKMVGTIDDLLDLTRQLFGTSSWLNTPHVSVMSSPHEEVGRN